MCWFAGFTYVDRGLLKSMWWTLQKRAIDNEYFFARAWYSFYHAHLKISDLDKDTSQPYVSEKYIIGLVGEIYNKSDILSDVWISLWWDLYTELEVIALAYEKFGESFIDRVNGEFAISIFDIGEKKYILYRDRWGVNNVYYRIYNNNLYYASEIKTLILETPICSKKSLIDHMIFQFWIGPETIIQDIMTLQPGTYLVFQNSVTHIRSFWNYEPTNNSNNIIEIISQSVERRVPHFQKRIFVGLSGWPDSNLILFFLRQYYHWDIIAYSFLSENNASDIEIAQKNAKKQWIRHLILDTELIKKYIKKEEIYVHEWLVTLANLWSILRKLYPEFDDIKVEFWWDGKEELVLWNNHYPYKDIIRRYKYFYQNNFCAKYEITQKFLNLHMFDYNLQMIDKITLRNGLERRLPFTDYELLKFFWYKNYRQEAELFLRSQWLDVVAWEYGYDLWIDFKNHYDAEIIRKKNELFLKLQKNIIT